MRINDHLIVRTKRWLDSDEFKEMLTIADYIGREDGHSKFMINVSKVMRMGYDVSDVIDILERYNFTYDEDLVNILSEKLSSRITAYLELGDDGTTIIMRPDRYLGRVYEELREFVSYDKVNKVFRIKPYYFFTVIKILSKLNFNIVDRTGLQESMPLPSKVEFTGELRDYQREAIDRWSANNCRGVIALPTGSGKTVIGIAGLCRLSERTLIVTYTKEQLMQWREALLRFTNISHNLIGLYYSEEKRIAPITLTTYQTAYKNISKLMHHFTFLLIDEVHHLPAEKFKRIALNTPAPFRMGLSATPYREDGKHTVLFPLMGGVVYYKTPSELAERGYLAPYEVITVYVKLTPEERKKYIELIKKYRSLVGSAKFDDVLKAAKNGDERALEALKLHTSIKLLVQKSKSKIEKTKEIIMHELERGNKVIVFAHYVDLAEEIAKSVGGLLLTGNIDDQKRVNILNKFKHMKGGVLVVTTVGDEGLDIPDASVGILVAGTGSRRQFIQRLGRLLRPKEGKQAVLYEIIVKGTSEEIQSRKRKVMSFEDNQQT